MSNLAKLRYYGVRVAFGLAVTLVALAVTVPFVRRVLRPAVLDYAMTHLSDSDRKELYDRIASRAEGIFEAVPEPLVSRLTKPNLRAMDYQTEVVTNNAGLRSATPYGPKEPQIFRIACLGDSFVFGTAGREEDRFCDQMGKFYADHHVQVGGKFIETYALGVGGWNAVQEASYLSSRLSAYDPDVIVVLTVENDLIDSYGVTGSGGLTSDFSPEYRDRGSAFFSSQAGLDFGEGDQTALNTDLGPESRAHWRKAMVSLKRLTDLQHRRKKLILHSVLRYNDSYFFDLYKRYFEEFGIGAPMIVTSFFYSPQTRLEHDSHPNRLGHSILASHYVNELNKLGWVPVPVAELPKLHEGLSLDTPKAQPEALRAHRREFASSYLKTSLDFGRLRPDDVKSFLGGIFPERKGPEGLSEPPWATVRSGFLLRRPTAANTVDIRIGITSLIELFPFQVRVSVDGATAQVFRFDEPRQSGVYEFSASVPLRSPEEEPAVEIIMETDSYFTWIDDHRMKSFRLLSARVH